MNPSGATNRASVCAAWALSFSFVATTFADVYTATAPKPAKPAPAQVSQGLVNDWLREQSPAFADWDIGGQFRMRYEAKDNAGFVSNRDCIKQSAASVPATGGAVDANWLYLQLRFNF